MAINFDGWVPYREYDKWSRWPLRAIGKSYFVELCAPALQDSRQTLPVLDVTHLAPKLKLNQGGINADGSLVWGPGEAYVNCGSEGGYALVLLNDGTNKQVGTEYLTAIVQVKTPTGDDLYPEA